MIFNASGIITTTLLLISCGTKTTTGTTDTTTATYTSTDLTKDPETSAALVATQIDNITTAISSGETGGSGSTLISLTDGSENRTCTANSDNTATVSITYSGSDARSVGKATVSVTRSGTESRVWSKTDGTAVTCNANQRPKINWTSSSFAGVTTNITTDRTNVVSKSYTNIKGVTFNVSRTNELNGTKVVSWKDLSNKSIVSSIASKLSIMNAKGETKVLDAINEVRITSPLVIQVTRDSSTGKPNSQKIVSGINYSKKTGAFSTTTEFSNVIYDSTSTDPCTPTSGVITLKIYSDDSYTTVSQTNILTYTASVLSVTTDGVMNTDFATYTGNHTNHNCDLTQTN
jgi:hypothetical protein